MVTNRFQRGFTLIEVLVVLAIIGILAAVGIPLTTNWISSSRIDESRHKLMQGMATAKALALKNANGANNGGAVAALVSFRDTNGIYLCVYAPVPSMTSLSCANNPQFTARLDASLKLNNVENSCIALDSAALPVAATIGSTACTTTLTYSLARGAGSGTITTSGMLN